MPNLYCPKAKNGGTKPIEICLKRCEEKVSCDALRKLRQESPDALPDAMKRLKIPLSKLKEFEDVIEVETLPEEEPEGTEPDGEFRESEESAIQLQVDDGKEAKELYERAMNVRGKIEESFWTLGHILARMFTQRYLYGYETWKLFCEQDPLFKALDLGYRSADYLRALDTRFAELGIKPEECKGIGWSRLKEILPIVEKKNAKEWLDKARKLNVKELNLEVRKATGRITEEDLQKETTRLTFNVYREQLEIIERALTVAGKVAESDSKARAFECICADYLSGAEGQEDQPKAHTVKNLMERIEAVFRVKVEGVSDEQTGEIIYEGR